MGNVRANEWKNKIYQNWRKSVFERDGHKCLQCGRTDKLHAHHIEPYFKCIEKRYDVNNGQTLCNSCHTRIESTGRKQSFETRLKRRESRKWYKHSEETKKKISKGHIGISPSQEVRERISKKLMGNIPWSAGVKFTEEHKKKLSEAKKGKAPPNKGKPMRADLKEKLRLANIGRPSARKGVKLSEETKRKISEAKRKNK